MTRTAAPITVVTLLVAVLTAGCSPGPVANSPRAAPRVSVPTETWKRVDEDIRAASLEAKDEARRYAISAMDDWFARVRRQTEEEFIPWYTSYWTQQWLAVKVAWYETDAEDGGLSAEERLTTYLQEEYWSRVLEPVSEGLDPNQVRDNASSLYVSVLGDRVRDISAIYSIPRDQFDERLKRIPAIVLSRPAGRTSLHELLQTNTPTRMAAYRALLAWIDRSGDGVRPAIGELDAVAARAAGKLTGKLAVRGGGAAAAAMVGGVIGVVISAGFTGWGIAEHEKDKPDLEAQLKGRLNVALYELWYPLVEDPEHGVTAPVYYISQQLEKRIPPASAGADWLERMVPAKEQGQVLGPESLF